MRILTRYILGEISSHSLIGCALFTFILLMKPLEQILDMVVRNSSSFEVVLEVFLFTLPNIFLVSIPMAVLVGVLLGLSRLAADSEITAMRASGLGVWYFVRVAAIVAVLGTVAGLVNALYVIPRANQGILDTQRALESSQASFEIQPRVFYEEFKNAVIYVQNVRAGTGVSNWQRVFMADVSDSGFAAHHDRGICYCRSGQWRGERQGIGQGQFRAADSPAQRDGSRDGDQSAGTVQYFNVCPDRQAAGFQPAK